MAIFNSNVMGLSCQKIQFLNLILVMDGQALKDVPNACRHNKSQFDITNIPFSGTKNNVC